MSINTQLSQIVGMALYEFRMHWRARALLVVTLAIGAMNIFSILIFNTNSMDLPVVLDATYAVVGLISAPLTVTLAILVPIVMSDTIPKDQQYGVREVLDALPVSRGVYLAGKVLGVWAGVMSGLLILAIVTAIIYQLAAGAFHVGVYLEMWLIVSVSLVVINGSIGVLLPIGQPNRRRAVLLMVAFFIVPFLILSDGFSTASTAAYLNPIRPMIIFYYISNMGAGIASSITMRDVMLSILTGLVELILVWAVAWGWQRWKDNKS